MRRPKDFLISIGKPPKWRASWIAVAVCLLVPNIQNAQVGAPRLLHFSEVHEVLGGFLGSGLPGSDIQYATSWDKWIVNQDREVRRRIDRGTEDSISNLILYGTSYTNLPRLNSADQALSADGELTTAAKARIHSLALALARSTPPNERIRIVRDFLRRQGGSKFTSFDSQSAGANSAALEKYLASNLKRFVIEHRAYQEKLRAAGQDSDAEAVLATRGTLFEKRGLSVDTSLPPNFALEDTLRALVRKGVLQPGSIRRIAVIGPGLDFADKRDGYDFYPLQTVQPFAVMEGVLRLRLAGSAPVQIVTLDLNSFVNEHVERLAERAHAGKAYVLQLPRDSESDWNTASIAYWEHFGEIIGSPARPLPAPAGLDSVTLRAVSIPARHAAQLTPVDLDIVAQTLDLPAGAGFDLVVATNILVYYDRFQQALAMTSIAHMMNRGGIFLANNALPAIHPQALNYLGRRSVSYSRSGAYGDDVVVYQKR